MSDIETTVLKTLADNAIAYTIAPAGVGLVRDSWECDGWRVTLTCNGKSECFDYYTGTGHRKISEFEKLRIAQYWSPIKTPTVRANYLHDIAKASKPVAPHIAGVLHSLVMDSSALDESFTDWCSTFGYDSDSIKKAFVIYRACCDNAQKLRRVMPGATLAQLAETLQDY